MTAQQLKNSILQMAVQGKLVPQDPNDEPASVLLERIRAEKERLIKEKKVKREKNPSAIFRGPDNTPYEKVGDVVAPLEVPFDIPESWEWVRLGDVCEYIQRGKSPKYSSIQKYPVISQKCNQWNGFSIEKAQFIEPDSLASYGPERILQDNDLMWNSTGLGTLGRIAIYKAEINPYDLAVADSHVTVIRPFKQFVLSEYLYFYFANPTVQSIIEDQADGTTKQKELSTATIKSYLTPIPPLEEQHRIFAKLSELLSIVQNYSEVYSESIAMQLAFPERLKKSILQQAVQGKLVPQDPADEPAEILLKRIQAEKQRLIKEGKIKKDKHESVIFKRDNSHYEIVDDVERCIDEELPFEIPENWCWCRLGALVQINPRNTLSDDTEVGFIPMSLIKDGFNNNHSYEARKWREIKTGFTHFANGDVVIAKITPCFQNRKSALIAGLPNSCGAGTTELLVLRDNTHLLYMPYLLLLCKTHDFIISGMKRFTGTAGQQRIGKGFIANYLVPLPPKNEQKRIIAKTRELLSICEQL